MREIKFRGKRADNGEWVYGDLMQFYNNGHRMNSVAIWSTQVDEVLTNTVGQFTGLHDKNGKEIYEGDIIRTYGSKGDEIKHTVCYSDNEAMFCTKLIGADMLGGGITQRWLDEFEFEVIGNKWDNPELLKGGEK